MLIDTDELLSTLYDKFPDRVPDMARDMRELGVKVGEQTVMKFIEHIVEQKSQAQARSNKPGLK